MTPRLGSGTEMREEKEIGSGDDLGPGEPSPEGDGARFAIPFTSQEPTQRGYHAGGFPQSWFLV